MKFGEFFRFGGEREKEGRENAGFDKQAIPENPGNENLADEGSPNTEKAIRAIEKRIKELDKDPNADYQELATLKAKLDNLHNTLEKGL